MKIVQDLNCFPSKQRKSQDLSPSSSAKLLSATSSRVISSAWSRSWERARKSTSKCAVNDLVNAVKYHGLPYLVVLDGTKWY